MKVVFRVDGSREIGSGHVMRCLTLAERLKLGGAEVVFVCREHTHHLIDRIRRRSFTVASLPRCDDPFVADSPPHAAWLGATWERDAQQTRDAMASTGGRPDCLVVDHYGIDARWHAALRPQVERIVAIDDLADRPLDCDVLIDQNVLDPAAGRYARLVPATALTLLGPRYALLQPAFAELHDRTVPREGPVRRILIFFGTGDRGLTARTLDMLERGGTIMRGVEVDVVLGSDDNAAKAVRAQYESNPRVHLHQDLPSLAPLMAAADLSIGAAGATTWERLCLGLPSLVVTVAMNQRYVAEQLSRAGLIRWLGDAETFDSARLTACLDAILSGGLERRWSLACRELVDGKGVQRVIDALASFTLRLRPASARDEAILLRWANDPVTRRNALATETISPSTHSAWFAERLASPDRCRLYLCESDAGVPIGQVRFERRLQDWEIDFALDPSSRGKGLGATLLRRALEAFRNELGDVRVVGRVKEQNAPSRRVFEAVGFQAVSCDDGLVEYRPGR